MTYPTCTKKDHDGFDLVCGYPLPCPYHTVTIDVAAQTVTMPVGDGVAVTLSAERAGRLGEIAQALQKPTHKPSRGRR